MPTRIRIILLILAGLSLSCSMPGLAKIPPAGREIASLSPQVNAVIDKAPPGSTPTSTPFLPLPPTATFWPTDFPTPEASPTSTAEASPTVIPSATPPLARSWADYPGPSIWPDIELPAPTGILPQPEGQINILLLGSDQRQNDFGFRTDTILLLTLNPKTGSANLTSIPRDLYVYIPGWTVQRVNTAFPHGGFETMALTMEYNLGVRPDHYVLINFWSFSQVIDNLGGVNVNVAMGLTDHRDGYGQYSVPPGVVHMDGETALWYVRSRYSSSDFDRGRRQQEVIQAIFTRLISLNGLSRAPELYEIYKRNVTTDMTFDEMAALLPLAADLSDNSNIQHFFIGPQQVTSFRNSNGAAVLLPIREAVLTIMRQALNIP